MITIAKLYYCYKEEFSPVSTMKLGSHLVIAKTKCPRYA